MNLPLSTIYPPIAVPCPPTALVADPTTTSAPCSRGLNKPTAEVLSIINGISCACAISANFSKSGTSNFGFPIASA